MDAKAWLAAVARTRAIAQTGLAYAKDPFDAERYRELQGLAERMLADLAETSVQRIGDLYLPERGYPTPKIDVRAGVFRGGEILLVRERSDGRWALPGGWADESEPPTACVVREVEEESGFLVRVQKLVAIKDRHLHPYQAATLHRVYKLFFLCELLGGEPATSVETSAAEFFPTGNLPPLSLGRTLEDDIHLLREHQGDPLAVPYVD